MKRGFIIIILFVVMALPAWSAPRHYQISWSWGEARWGLSYNLSATFTGPDIDIAYSEMSGEAAEFLGVASGLATKFPFSCVGDLTTTLNIGNVESVDLQWVVPFLTTEITIDLTNWLGIIGALRALFGWLFVVIILKRVIGSIMGMI